ncbi:MAG: CDP-alcohol phosphatidyltransferase family protein [Bacteroidetes bacterium]|jgi:CDP-diacylglycerol---serine O-phosphatidyltransferase|nr:CDP-alcohol phosphatidyltransferase family protein [Bacteroidota bacterium]MBL7915982.1 CDP-alcohol phosphatidyltransferase family protein [Bacteroidia bacterium]
MKASFTQHIPNLLTCMNLACGCVALVFVFQGNIPVFASLVAASLVFDFLDGFTARAFKAYSPMGKELDSLADMVTFGLLPGAIMYHLFISSVPMVLYQDEMWMKILSFLPFLITIFSALRLAKFNIDTRQTDSFIGMPTPAVTIFVIGLALILHDDRFSLTPTILNSFVIAGLSMILSFLLVSEIPLFALKFKSFSWQKNQVQYTFLVLTIISLVTLQFAGIPVVIILYLILSLINPPNKTVKNTENN